MNKKIDCTVIGDAMIDIIIPLSTENINYLHHGNIINTESITSPGGTANIAVAISRLGGKSAFVGKVGNDHFGKIFSNDLNKNKVIPNVSVSKKKRTGIVFDLVSSDGERHFIVDRGANADLRYEDINFDLIQSNFLYFVGFSFQDKETSMAMQKVIKKASIDGVTVVFNPGAPNLAEKFRNIFLGVIKKYVAILILNDAEGRCLTGYNRDDDVINFLLSYADRIILTKASKGSIIATRDKIYNIKAYPANVVDTTGAGDAYAAAFIYGLIRKWKDDKAGMFASRIAGNVVSKKGARLDVQSNYIKTYPIKR